MIQEENSSLWTISRSLQTTMMMIWERLRMNTRRSEIKLGPS